MQQITRRLALAATLGATALVAGCASNPLPEIRAAYARGDYLTARNKLESIQKSDPSNAHVYALDRAMAELAVDDPQTAERVLRGSRDRLDELDSSSAAQWLGSVMLDDRQLEYAGADFEKVLVRALLAVTNLLNGGQDANAYALQVLERQQEIIHTFDDDGRHPKDKYKLVAFGSYLRGVLNEDDPLKLGVARESYQKAVELEPGCSIAQDSLQRVTEGQHSAQGRGVVHVIGLVGRGPFRIEVNEDVSQTALAIAQVIWAISRDRATLPNITSVPIPALAFHNDNPTEAHVEVDGRRVSVTEIVTDVDQTAHAEFEAMRDHIVARAVLRRAFKIAVTEGLKEAINPKKSDRDPNPWTDLAISVAGIAWTAAEAADLRCWSLVPASFQASRIEMPAGEHEITLRAGRNGVPVGRPQTVRVLVRDGYNTYVVGILPTFDGGPPPMTSEPAELPPEINP